MHITLWHGSSTFYLHILLCIDSQVPSNFYHHRKGCNKHPWHAQVSPCAAVFFRWPYHRGPECRWCHLEGVSRYWVHWKRSWDTSEHPGQRSERVPRNGQIHGQQQETSCNLKCKRVWLMAPSVSKCGGNILSRNVASNPKLPGDIALPMSVFLFFPLGTWRNED